MKIKKTGVWCIVRTAFKAAIDKAYARFKFDVYWNWFWSVCWSFSVTRIQFLVLILQLLKLFVVCMPLLFCPLPSFFFNTSSVLFICSLPVSYFSSFTTLRGQRLLLELHLLTLLNASSLHKPLKAFGLALHSISHRDVAAPTPAIPFVLLSRLCSLLSIDLANLVKSSLAIPRGWRPLFDQVIRHALIELVLV